MSDTCDLLVIGSGAGATTAAFTCARAGWHVAVVDDRPFGGTCALRGCDPKKVLVGVAHAREQARRFSGYGLGEPPAWHWPDLMAFKRTFTDPVPERKEKAFREAGIQPFHGTARFLDAHTLRVGEGEAAVDLQARHVLIAAGARPTPLPIDGADHLLTSDAFLDLDALPRRIAFVGGGYISMEFAFIARAAGAAVTVLHRGAHVLNGFEPDLADRLAEQARSRGIMLHLETSVTAIEPGGEGFVAHAETRSGKTLQVEADVIVHGAGRVPNVSGLHLDAAGVAYTERGVSVNAYLQSVSAPHVYAAGDCADTPGLPLTPVGGRESRVVAENLLHGNRRTVDYTGTPTVAFTDPPLASVGLTEAEARRAGLEIEVKAGDMSGWFAHRRLREEAAAYKVLIERDTDRIVGAHLLGTGAEDVINLFGLAMRQGLKAEALRQMIYAYPTAGSNIPYLL